MDGKSETSQQMRSSKKSNVAANESDDTPAAPRVRKYLDNAAVKNILEKIRKIVQKKQKRDNNAGRASCKRKLENNEDVAVKKEETMLETSNQSIPTDLSYIPQKSLVDIEMELVYTDEEDISFEFAEPVAPTSTGSAPCGSEKENALRAPNDSALPQVDKQLQTTLQEASTCYREENYTAAAEQFSTALELCGNGAAIDNPSESSPEDISSIASFIESKLVTCYLKLKKPDDALNHSHRSIILNSAYFRNHLRQAAVFRCLERYSEAARSAMIADYMYWLTGGTEQRISKLIKVYWQAMIEEAITTEVSFSVMYTPFGTEVKANEIKKIEDVFAKKHPDYVEHIYTDPHGLHILPQTTEWPSLPPQQYLLTLGFRNKHIGKILERWSNKKLPIFSERKAPFCPLTKEEIITYWDNTGKKIMPVIEFIRSSKLTLLFAMKACPIFALVVSAGYLTIAVLLGIPDGRDEAPLDTFCACSSGIEKLHYASFLSRLGRAKEQSQMINQAMAELATLPYLQDISQQDAQLLQSLMADAMDTLEGRRSDKRRVWNKIQKIGLIEDYLYQAEDNYLKRRLRTARTGKMKRTESTATL